MWNRRLCSPWSLILFCAFISRISGVLSTESGLIKENGNLNRYLTKRLRESRIEILKDYLSPDDDIEPGEKVSYNTKWESLESERFNFSEPILALSMFDKMFILAKNRTLSLDTKAVSNISRSAIYPRRISLINNSQYINIAKTILWKSRLYLLVCATDGCDLSLGEDDSRLKYQQTLKHRGMFDATFFTRDNRLYLVVTHEMDDEFLGSSTIYYWTGTYMDIIQPIATYGEVMVTTFNDGKWSIIVFGRPSSDALEIWKFRDNKVEWIQYLPTTAPTSITHYRQGKYDFLLIASEREPSCVYGWDGTEFFHWQDLPDIATPKKINIVQFNGDVLFVVMYETSVHVYKVTRSKYWRLNSLDLKTMQEKVLDVSVKVNDDAKILTIFLIIFDTITYQYRIEPWKLIIEKNEKNNPAEFQEANNATEQCLLTLEEKLNERMVSMENLTLRVWPKLLGSKKNVSENETFSIEELILDSTGSENSIKIDEIKVDKTVNESVPLSAVKHKKIIDNLSKKISSIFNQSREILRIDGDNFLTGDIVIEGDGEFQEIQTNLIRTSNYNGKKIKSENFYQSAVSISKNQTFTSVNLRGENVKIRQLSVDQLCGIPRSYWLRREDEENNIFANYDVYDITMVNDTALVKNPRGNLTVTLRNLEIHTIDSIDVNTLFNDLFVLGEKQIIEGNVIHEDSGLTRMKVENLVPRKLNGVRIEELITKNTEQNLTGSLHVKGNLITKNIIAKAINGVPVSNFAMVNRKNHFKGSPTISKITILNSLSITKELWKQPQVQIYENVTIFNNVKTRDIKIDPAVNFPLTNIENVGKNYWTKSSDQIIEKPVTFDKGIIIDELNVDYLNGLNLQGDVIFTDSMEIVANSYSLEFRNFTVNEITTDIKFSANTTNRPVYEVSEDAVIFNVPAHIEHLSVTDLFIDRFNGVPFDSIMNQSFTDVKIDETRKFNAVTVNEYLEIEDLYFNFLENETKIENYFLRLDENFTVARLESDELFVENLRINKKGMNAKLAYVKNCYLEKSDPVKNCNRLLIEGDALVEDNLITLTINQQNVSTYLEKLSLKNLSLIDTDSMKIEDLTVRGNLTLNLMSGTRFQQIYENVFSRSREQYLGYSRITFFDTFVHDLNVYKVNKRDMTSLILIDSPEFIITGDLVFDDLTISSRNPQSKPDIRVKKINGIATDELYTALGNITSKFINNFQVRGNVTWFQAENTDSKNASRLETLLRYGLIRNQMSPTIFQRNGDKGISIDSLFGVFVTSMKKTGDEHKRGINGIDIERIVLDSVLDDPRKTLETGIDGEKIFKKNLRCHKLRVSNAIDIKNLNNRKIADLTSSIVRLDLATESNSLLSMKNSTITFRKNIIARTLVIQNENSPLIHGSPVDGIFAARVNENSTLPPFTYFEDLVVLESARVKSLDRVNFDDFIRNRVSLDSERSVVVRGHFQFNGVIRVLGNVSANSINGIFPSDLVINDAPFDQTISGSKTLITGDLVINGKTNAPIIAGINLREAHNDSVFIHEGAEIFSDIIFEGSVENRCGLIKTSVLDTKSDKFEAVGFVNGIQLKNFEKNNGNVERKFFQDLQKNESRLATTMFQISTLRLPEIFYYFEEDNLTVSNVINVERARVTKFEEKTILDLYTRETGSFCRLPETCQCLGQSVVELSTNEMNPRSQKFRGFRIFYFHEGKSFIVKITTTSVSRSKHCSKLSNSSDTSEFTTISWIRKEELNRHHQRETESEQKIYGYMSDVAVFTENDLLFIVLAIYYNPVLSSHQTNSFVYEVNPATNELKLVQCIPTSYAVSVQVFHIPNEGRHVLFSCHAEGNSSESVLYRFQPDSNQLTTLQKIPNNGNRYAKSVTEANAVFLFLDDVQTNSINVYRYERDQKKFYHYQSIYYEAPISSIEAFYTVEYRWTRAYVIVATERDQFFIYEHSYKKFREITRKRVNGILSMIPFDIHQRRYIFIGTDKNSTIWRIIEQNNKEL